VSAPEVSVGGTGPLQVRDLMTAEVVAATRETPVADVARLMCDHAISGIPVIDASRRLLGMVTDLDLIVRDTALEPPSSLPLLDGRIPLETPAHYRRRLRHMLGTTAGDVMSEKVATVGPDDDEQALARLLTKHRVNPIPVVERGQLVGIVSRADLVRQMTRGTRP